GCCSRAFQQIDVKVFHHGRGQLKCSMDRQSLINLARSNDFGGRHTMCAAQQLLERKLKFYLILEQTPGMTLRMNQPGCHNAQLALLIFARQRVSLFKPFQQRWIVTINQFSAREKAVTKRGPCRSLDHSLESSPWN